MLAARLPGQPLVPRLWERKGVAEPLLVGRDAESGLGHSQGPWGKDVGLGWPGVKAVAQAQGALSTQRSLVGCPGLEAATIELLLC